MFLGGVYQLYLGGSETEGIDHYIEKLLAQKARHYSYNYVYDPVHDHEEKDIKLRLVRTSDFKQLARLYAEVYNDLEGLGERWTLEAARKFIVHLYSRQSDLFFIAENNNQIIGAVLAAVQPWWDGNHLVEGELFIRKDFLHAGVDAQLMKVLLRAAERNYQAISWDTIVPIHARHPFISHREFGFHEVPLWRAVSGDVRDILNRLQEPTRETH